MYISEKYLEEAIESKFKIEKLFWSKEFSKVIALGFVESGEFKIGDKVLILNDKNKPTTSTKVTNIQQFSKVLKVLGQSKKGGLYVDLPEDAMKKGKLINKGFTLIRK